MKMYKNRNKSFPGFFSKILLEVLENFFLGTKNYFFYQTTTNCMKCENDEKKNSKNR